MVADNIVDDYVAKLLPISEAARKFGMSPSTFLRLRRRYKIVSLPGKKVHVDDIIAAFERDRRHN